MKQMFSAFPAGLPGTALLLLRISVAASLIAAPVKDTAPDWVTASLAVLGVGLLLGVRTRIVAGLAAAAGVLMVWPADLGPATCFLTTALTAGAVALIGPGAFSIDARLFGRRTVHLAE